jgi:hypothetical protein
MIIIHAQAMYIVILHILYALSFLIFLSTVPGDPASA